MKFTMYNQTHPDFGGSASALYRIRTGVILIDNQAS